MLKEGINSAGHIRPSEMGEYYSALIRNTFLEATKPKNNGVPNAYIKLLKDKVSKKTTKGILGWLGYTSIAPSGEKVLYCLNHEGSVHRRKTNLVPIKESLSSEGRYHCAQAGFKLLLPFVDPDSNLSVHDQISIDPYRETDIGTRKFYKEQSELNNRTNFCYAIGKSVPKNSSKSTTSKFMDARGKLVSLARDKRIPLQDKKGKQYSNLSEVNPRIRDQLFSLLKFKINELKRKRSENTQRRRIRRRQHTRFDDDGNEMGANPSPVTSSTPNGNSTMDIEH
jgi:hypothetical protein